MVSSRDRSHSQRRDSLVRTIARTPPPAFLFPNQRCQRPDRLSQTPLFSAGGRRRRLSIDRPLSCQSVFSDFFAEPRFPGIWPQKPPRAAEGLPSKSVTIRLRLGNILISVRRSSAKFGAGRRSDLSPARAGGGYLVAVPLGVNRSFFKDPDRSPEAPVLRVGPCAARFGERTLLASPAGRSTARNG